MQHGVFNCFEHPIASLTTYEVRPSHVNGLRLRETGDTKWDSRRSLFVALKVNPASVLCRHPGMLAPGVYNNQPRLKISDRNPRHYLKIPLLAFLSRKATSNTCTCPLLRWMTEIKSECCMVAMSMPLTITLVTL
jgi:hypothetical protein